MGFVLSDSNILIDGASEKLLSEVYRDLRVSLLDSQISHFRPIAFSVEDAVASSTLSNISKIPDIGLSFSEMSFMFTDMIMADKRGIIPEPLKASASLSLLSSDCSFVTLIGDNISTMHDGSIFCSGEGISSKPEFLLENTTVFKKLKKSIAITVVLMFGKDFRDIQDNQRLIYRTGFKPIRTYYSLYEYFTVNEYYGGNSIRLNYRYPINEKVLYKILDGFFKERGYEFVKV